MTSKYLLISMDIQARGAAIALFNVDGKGNYGTPDVRFICLPNKKDDAAKRIDILREFVCQTNQVLQAAKLAQNAGIFVHTVYEYSYFGINTATLRSLAEAAGIVKGQFIRIGIEPDFVMPAHWKRKYKLIARQKQGDANDHILEEGNRVLGGKNPGRTKQIQKDIADAVCIGLYAMEKMKEKEDG